MISREKVVLDLTKKLMSAFQKDTFNNSKTPLAFIVIMMWYGVTPLLTEIGFPLRESGQ